MPLDLMAIKDEIKGVAEEFGLDFFETFFEVLDFNELNQVASFGGVPTRYPHWRFGMLYERLSKGFTYGLHRIYEMVINNDPCYAYLLKSNNFVDQKMVIAHVYGHSDFFKNNTWFSKTNRKMMDEMANHGTRIRKYIEKVGLEKVENFIDACLSIENLIDIHSPFILRHREKEPNHAFKCHVHKIKSKDYMDRFINPPEFLKALEDRIQERIEKEQGFPAEPELDVLNFLLENAPLEKWQQDVLSIIREEAYYFAPQAQTKIMNEGWATYWHSVIMTQRCLNDSELIDYADHHSGTLGTRPGVVNPYKLGLELFRDIEERWNKGRFGPEWENCESFEERSKWDKHLGRGREKIFEVRRIHNDVTFIDSFLTEEFCREQKLFVYRLNPRSGKYEIVSREFKKVKEQLLTGLTNLGQPVIYVVDGNHANRGELYLWHKWTGIDLQLDYAEATLRNIQKFWKRPVHIETKVEGKGQLISFDGEKTSMKEISPTR